MQETGHSYPASFRLQEDGAMFLEHTCVLRTCHLPVPVTLTCSYGKTPAWAAARAVGVLIRPQ